MNTDFVATPTSASPGRYSRNLQIGLGRLGLGGTAFWAAAPNMHVVVTSAINRTGNVLMKGGLPKNLISKIQAEWMDEAERGTEGPKSYGKQYYAVTAQTLSWNWQIFVALVARSVRNILVLTWLRCSQSYYDHITTNHRTDTAACALCAAIYRGYWGLAGLVPTSFVTMPPHK